MTILILGSEGFIGKHLVTYYLAKGDLVFGADLWEVGSQNYSYFKISRLSPEYDELLQRNQFDICINAAGSGNVPYSMTHPVSDFEANSLDTIRLLDGIRRFQSNCRYIHISSAAIYGNPQRLPINEKDILHPLSPYGWHKLIAEQICKEYTQVYNVPTAIARPFSVYGNGLKKQLIWDLFHKASKANAGTEIELWGTGNESRDFIFIDDLLSAFDIIVQKGQFEAEPYNIASGIEITVRDVAELLIEQIDKPVSIRFNQHVRPGDPQNWRADISKLQNLGFELETSFPQGIIKTAKWLKGLE